MTNDLEKIIILNLLENIDIIYTLLSKFVSHIKKSSDGKTLRFDINHNSNAYVLSLENLIYFNFRENEYGNILDLIVKYNNITKNKLIGNLYIYLQKLGKINIETEGIEYEDKYVFEFPQTYDKSELDKYKRVVSELFLKDGIDYTTQQEFDIRYDISSKRIVIPVFYNKELIGAIGRRNTTVLQDYDNKYLPVLPYKKSQILFGYDTYFDLIQKTKTVLLVESEKSVLKMWQMNSKIPTLAMGSSSLSRNQIEILKLLNVDKVIIAMDKSVEYDKTLFPNIDKLKKYGKECKISYIDVNSVPDNLLDEKESICDRNKEEINNIFKNYIKYT